MTTTFFTVNKDNSNHWRVTQKKVIPGSGPYKHQVISRFLSTKTYDSYLLAEHDALKLSNSCGRPFATNGCVVLAALNKDKRSYTPIVVEPNGKVEQIVKKNLRFGEAVQLATLFAYERTLPLIVPSSFS